MGTKDEKALLRNLIVMAIFVFATLGCLLAVVIGVTVPPSEPGFLEGAPIWDRADLPIQVSVGRYNVEGTEHRKEDIVMVKRVLKRINKHVGVKLFQLNADPMADIAIELGVPWEVGGTGEEGRAEIRQHMQTAVGCDVIVTGTVPWAIEPAVVYHELGHCLGLAHDERPFSIMYPDTTKESVGRDFTPHDVELLRERYGQRPESVDASSESD